MEQLDASYYSYIIRKMLKLRKSMCIRLLLVIIGILLITISCLLCMVAKVSTTTEGTTGNVIPGGDYHTPLATVMNINIKNNDQMKEKLDGTSTIAEQKSKIRTMMMTVAEENALKSMLGGDSNLETIQQTNLITSQENTRASTLTTDKKHLMWKEEQQDNDAQVAHPITEVIFKELPHSNTQKTTSTNPPPTTIPAADIEIWKNQLIQKLICRVTDRLAGYYLYHVRKAAGTTIRDIVSFSAKTNRFALYETEGITLPAQILKIKHLLSMISLRDPIDRIYSLYWYEHVGWYIQMVKKPDKCKTFVEWVHAWKDNADWKMKILNKTPENNYVEIENYYVKLLIGWKSSDGPITREQLQVAKERLSQFDVIFIKEWLEKHDQEHYTKQLEMMSYLFPVTVPMQRSNHQHQISLRGGHQQQQHQSLQSFWDNFYNRDYLSESFTSAALNMNKLRLSPIVNYKKVQGNHDLQTNLYQKLMKPQEKSIRQMLIDINQYDIELFMYAKELVSQRLAMNTMIQSTLDHELHTMNNNLLSNHPDYHEAIRNKCHWMVADQQNQNAYQRERRQQQSIEEIDDVRRYFGLFQPAGHKGPQ